MEKTKHKRGDIPMQIFKPSSWTKFGFVIVFIFVAIHFMIMTGSFDQVEAGAFHLIFVPFYGVLFFSLYLSSTEVLHVYEDGIEHRYGSRRSFVRWDNMAAFEWRSHGKSSSTGIRTYAAIEDEVPGSFIEKIIHWRGDKHYLRLSGIISIPTRYDGCLTGRSVDLDKLRYTEFGRIAYEYAPQLFNRTGKLKYSAPSWKK